MKRIKRLNTIGEGLCNRIEGLHNKELRVSHFLPHRVHGNSANQHVNWNEIAVHGYYYLTLTWNWKLN